MVRESEVGPSGGDAGRPRFVLPPVPPPRRRIRRRRQLRLAALAAAASVVLGAVLAWAVGAPRSPSRANPSPAVAASAAALPLSPTPPASPSPPPSPAASAAAPPPVVRAATLAQVPALLRADPASVGPVLRLAAGLAAAGAQSGPARGRALAALAPELADPGLPQPLVVAVQESAATYVTSGRTTGLLAELTRNPGPRAGQAVTALRALPRQRPAQQARTAQALLAQLRGWSRARTLRPDLAAALSALLGPVAHGQVHL